MSFPKRAEVEAKLSDLIAGHCTRADAADWAQPWVIMHDPPIDDWGVWETLGALCGADSPTVDRPYLYDEKDFKAWLEDLRSAEKG